MPHGPTPAHAAAHLSDLYEVAHRIHRLGIPDTAVDTDKLSVKFWDHRVKARVVLTIKSWTDGSSGWYWYADIVLPDGFDLGALTVRRMIPSIPYPRQVVRMYQARIWWERRPPQRKQSKRR